MDKASFRRSSKSMSRLYYRLKAIKNENKALKKARKDKVRHQEQVFENEDTRQELLARSRYLLYKAQTDYTISQQALADILSKEYPLLKGGYNLIEKLRNIYNTKIIPQLAITKLAQRHERL